MWTCGQRFYTLAVALLDAGAIALPRDTICRLRNGPYPPGTPWASRNKRNDTMHGGVKMINLTYLRWLIIMGLLEGTSTLVLFGVAMPLKYYADMPMAVTIVGMIHGLLFIGLAAMFIIGRNVVPISSKLMWWGLIGAVVPLVPFIVDIPLYRMLHSAKPGDEEAA
jgi:integral membrane protein